MSHHCADVRVIFAFGFWGFELLGFGTVEKKTRIAFGCRVGFEGVG